jgi:LytS/YehU family sensor histidine kinase
MEQYQPGLERNTLMLLRSYQAAHAVFNGLAALQLALLTNEREQGLYLLNLFSGYLRNLSALGAAPHISWMDEQAALHAYAALENTRYKPECSLEWDEVQSSFQVPGLLCMPLLERQLFRALRATMPVVLKVTPRAMDGAIQLEVQASQALPAFKDLTLRSEQRLRMELFEERMQLFGAEIEFKESAKGAILTLKKHQSL